MGNDFTICNAKKKLPFQIDPCNCAKYYNAGTYMDCGAGTIAINGGCGRDDKPCQSKPWLRCGINIPFNDTQCREIWPEDFKFWKWDKIQTFLDTHSEKESTTTTTLTPETTITLVASLATFLVLAIIFILFLILWISFRRKRNSTPDDKFASSNVQNVNENNHPNEEIYENTTTTSFCNSSIANKNTSTTTNPRNISEKTYENLEEESSPRYDNWRLTNWKL
ncbi:uncharacterized protein LOC115211618 isoform X4 [Octopus sinensis]|uniref:Uncharacterized protein LOC115211618 isoform X4 n=1 Tax=Octopus sinensis TaxID=2607531 RepID=A0A7E6EVW6_9MOLL|nr:uncharacterized protein LOC115211618 isoform X4 [Octopus sinensis]